MHTLSIVVLTKNEEKNIVDCIESVQEIASEIIVIDDNSEDRTVEVAKKLGAKVFLRSLDNDFSKQRNFGLSKAKNEWVLFLDSDERVSSSLRDEISNLKTQISNLKGFFIKRTDFMWKKELKHGETGNIKLLRLARRDAGRWRGKVHETWDIKDSVSNLQNSILHYPHQTISEFLKEINFYTDLMAWELYKQKVHSSWYWIILYPKVKFFLNYILKGGFMDGIEGLVFAILMSFHSFLVRAKLWFLWQKNSK